MLLQRGIFPSSSAGHTQYFLIAPFMYRGHFGFSGHSNSVITGLFLPYMYRKCCGVLLLGSFKKKKNGVIVSKEECEPKTQRLAEEEYD